MGEGESSSSPEGLPGETDSQQPAIVSPSRPIALDDDDVDARTIYTVNTQYYARARSIYPGRRGDGDTLNSVRSIYDSNVLYHDIHGRRYCKEYFMPNDEEEQSRMQMLNSIYYSLLGQKLTTVPLVDPTRILDIGTGTGEWAMAMGEEYPDAEIIGTDIAKIQPTSAPENVFFEVDDAEEESGWAWAENEFDLIHFRYMAGAFMSWDEICREALRHLKPGGWIEILDFDNDMPDELYVTAHTTFPKWANAIFEGARRSGRPRTLEHMNPERLEKLGFVETKVTTIDLPMGVWAEDKQMLKNTKHFFVTFLLGMEAVCLRLLTEHMGWTADAVRETCEAVAQDLWKVAMDPVMSQGFSFNLKVLVGRKPGGATADASKDEASSRPVTGNAETADAIAEGSKSDEQTAAENE